MTREELQKVFARVDFSGECWLWTGGVAGGNYSAVTHEGRSVRVHRLVYEHFRGPIPEGLTLDHLCHTADKTCRGGPECSHRRCVNPEHLEPVTHLENVRRGRGCKRDRDLSVGTDFCKNGHAMIPENVRFNQRCRRCRRCESDLQLVRYYKRKAALRAQGLNTYGRPLAFDASSAGAEKETAA